MTPATDKTRWNALVDLHRIHGELTALAARFERIELDPDAVKEAAKALESTIEEVEQDAAEQRQRSEDYHRSTSPVSEVERLRLENVELKRRLAKK